MSKQIPDLNLIHDEHLTFKAGFDSVLMATVGADGVPDASYAAYVQQDDDYYVYISELSQHTQNLLDTGQVSLLFIENEISANHLFARKRVTLRSDAIEIERESAGFMQVMELFTNRHGDFMLMLSALQDFHLFRITPIDGTYVRGFAQAFRLEGEGLSRISHINDRGHRASNRETRQQFDRLASP